MQLTTLALHSLLVLFYFLEQYSLLEAAMTCKANTKGYLILPLPKALGYSE